MKLINLLPLRETDGATTPELIALPYFREFQTKHGYKPLFKYLGTKSGEHIFTAPADDLGALELIITEAQIMAKVTEKEAVFGLIYTCNSLEKMDGTICKMTQKGGIIEVMAYDSKDKKNFDAKTTKFASLIS